MSQSELFIILETQKRLLERQLVTAVTTEHSFLLAQLLEVQRKLEPVRPS